MEQYLFDTIAGLLVMTLTAIGLTAIALEWAQRAKVLDVPNPRSSHRRPIPRGGGVVIAGMTLATGVLCTVAKTAGTESTSVLIVWLGAGLALAVVSFADDLRPRSARLRLAIHAFAAAAVLSVLPGWPALDLPGLPALGWGPVGTIVLFAWIIGLTNFFNFMDGIDGLAGIQASVAAAGWILLGLVLEEPLLLWLGIAVCSTAIAFLLFNWPPARLFMGDVGSIFLGFSFATFPLLGLVQETSRDPTLLMACAGLFVWPFLFDSLYTLCRRTIRRENLLEAHRSHLYQRLVISGLSHARVSLIYGVLACSGVLLAHIWIRGNQFALVITLPVIGTLASLLAVWTRRRERARREGTLNSAE